MRRWTPFRFVCLVLATILLAAAGLEAHRLATEPVADKDLFSNRWILMSLVEFEILLGMWLLTGVYDRLAWLMTLTCFAVFTAVSLTRGLRGQADCGCFGKVQVNPWYTFTLDIAAIAALLLFRPGPARGRVLRHVRLRTVTGSVLVLAAGIPAGWAMGSFRPDLVTQEADLIGSGGVVLMEPATWVGRRFPLLSHIDVGEKLAGGRWVVMLFSKDCSTCAEALPRYRRLARGLRGRKVSVALVEMPPYGHSRETPTIDGPLWGRLDARRDWFVTTPVVVVLVNGAVTGAWEGNAPTAEQLLERLP